MIQRASGVSILRSRGRFFEGTEVVFAGEFVFFLSGEVEGSYAAILTLVRALVPISPLVNFSRD